MFRRSEDVRALKDGCQCERHGVKGSSEFLMSLEQLGNIESSTRSIELWSNQKVALLSVFFLFFNLLKNLHLQWSFKFFMKINQVALSIQINPLTISLFLFFQGLTARRLPLSKECYVSKLDPTLPTPQKLKLDMELVRFVVSYVITTIYLTIHSNQRKKEGHYSVELRHKTLHRSDS